MVQEKFPTKSIIKRHTFMHNFYYKLIIWSYVSISNGARVTYLILKALSEQLHNQPCFYLFMTQATIQLIQGASEIRAT